MTVWPRGVRGSRKAERLSEFTRVSELSDPYDLIRAMPAKGDRLVVALANAATAA